ncbi:unnamed protein product [Bemisia tabaci]|uniref:Uncharacterized protein n=1 Tax=Bemisia tabaci TaxID=7038 RepID=A0A9P0F7C8_BEMTA|nr:unnamed protein product [Bemisia tabaci]
METGTVRLSPVRESFNVDDGFSIHDLKDIGLRIEERVIRLVLINSSQLESKSINILESIPIAKSAEIVTVVESVNMTG